MSSVNNTDESQQYFPANNIPKDESKIDTTYGYHVTSLGIRVVAFPLFKLFKNP